MKKYKLLRDLPDAKTGEILTQSKDGRRYTYGTESYWGAKQVESHPQWFEEIPEQQSKEPFVWTDELVKEFVEGAIKVQATMSHDVNITRGMHHFKKSKSSHQPESKKDKDWEIVSFIKGEGILTLSNGKYRNETNSIGLEACLNEFKFQIHSVLRKSDNTQWQIGKEVSYDGKEWWKIKGFHIYDNNIGVLGEVTLNNGKKDIWRKCNLNNLKRKPPTLRERKNRLLNSEYTAHIDGNWSIHSAGEKVFTQSELDKAQREAFDAGRLRIGRAWNEQIKNWEYSTFSDYQKTKTKKP